MENNNNDRLKFVTTIHITALDGIVNVNSLFTLAVFIGLAWNPNDPNNRLNDDPNCVAGPKIAEDLICFHVYSFSCFLFSSLVALGLKQAIRIAKTSCETRRTFFTLDFCHINKTALRVGYLVSAVGSVCGCGFLMMALVDVAQIKLGTLRCGSSHTYVQVKKMEAPMKCICLVGILVVIGIAGFNGVDGAGECGKANPDMEAFKLAPCASAANDDSTTPSSNCCAQVKKMGQNPKCLCAVMLSNTAKSSGIKLSSAITIPKRCDIADRPIGYKCGAYTLP